LTNERGCPAECVVGEIRDFSAFLDAGISSQPTRR
jgi:hypothetical protein